MTIHEQVRYPEAVERAMKIKKGMSVQQVLELLGEPQGAWVWRFTELDGFPGLPPPAGTTVFTGVGLTFVGGLVTEIHLQWIDATGPAPKQP